MIDARSLFSVEINVIITDFNSHLSFFISYYVFKNVLYVANVLKKEETIYIIIIVRC